MLLRSVALVILISFRLAGAELPPPGTVVTSANMEQYREVLHPSLEYFLRKGMVIPVIESKSVPWPPLYRQATEKFSAQVKLSIDGRDLVDYVAGAPFPTIDPNDPFAAVKWMWNQDHKTPYSDNCGCGWNVELVNSRGERERFFGSNFWRRMMWRGRLFMDPKPTVPHDPAVIDIDAIWTWNSKISLWSFKYLGEKKMLTAYHAGAYGQREAWCAQPDGASGALAFIFCVPHEIRDTVVIEGTPTALQQYAYGKRVLYIDKETFMAQVNEGYDHGGELWKTWYMMSDAGTRPHGIRASA